STPSPASTTARGPAVRAWGNGDEHARAAPTGGDHPRGTAHGEPAPQRGGQTGAVAPAGAHLVAGRPGPAAPVPLPGRSRSAPLAQAPLSLRLCAPGSHRPGRVGSQHAARVRPRPLSDRLLPPGA